MNTERALDGREGAATRRIMGSAGPFGPIAASVIILAACSLPARGQESMLSATTRADGQANAAPAEGGEMAGEKVEIAHPFFTHMGLPEGVGVFNLRLSALAIRNEGATTGDFAFHLETGLSSVVGLHIRNDSFLTNPRTEAMFQFAVWKSKDGMSGFAPLIEFEVPTKSGVSRVETLVGFSTAFVGERAAFNQVLHYNPREDMIDGSAALVVRVGTRFFPIVEILAEAARGETPIVSLVGGLKVRVSELLTIGFAFQVATTQRQDFTSRLVLQPDIEWKAK